MDQKHRWIGLWVIWNLKGIFLFQVHIHILSWPIQASLPPDRGKISRNPPRLGLHFLSTYWCLYYQGIVLVYPGGYVFGQVRADLLNKGFILVTMAQEYLHRVPPRTSSSVPNVQVKQPRQETWSLRLQQFSRSGCVHYWLCSLQSWQLMFIPFGREAHPVIKILNKFNAWSYWPFSASVS